MIRTHRAFSLLELLAVLAIVSILLALVLPVASAIRNQSRNTACQSNLRQIGAAVNLYAADNGRYPLSAYDQNSLYRGWYQLLLGQGPSASYDNQTRSFIDGSGGPNYLGSREVLSCPAGSWTTMGENPSSPVSYAMTDLVLWHYSSQRTDEIPQFFTSLLNQPSKWPLVMDGEATRIFGLNNPTEDAQAKQRYAARHDGLANVLMVDGHIEQLAYGDTRWSESNLNRNHYYEY
jgi:prepilin-type N-terminal cleavage/methylation domain-containing protein/prepilin-type processing-associated H-X9-DG protein